MQNEDNGRKIAAYVLIALGVLFLFGGFNFNWWAIFIALPGLAMLNNVYQAYNRQGKLENNDFVQGFIGLFLVLMAASFLLNIDIGFLWNLWPLILVGIGLNMLFNRSQEADKNKREES